MMAEASIPVDLTNPGQVFACLGLVEAAVILLGAARGGFDWRDEGSVQFRLAANGDSNPIERVLRFLDEATVTAVVPAGSTNNTSEWKIKWKIETVADDSGSFPFEAPSKPGVLPALLTDASGHRVIIDHWGDTTQRRDKVKFWAGAGGYPGVALTRDALGLIRGKAAAHSRDPFSLSALQGSSFRFDLRRDYVPMDAGFSPNEHETLIMQGYPIVELLAAIGLANARPCRHDKLKYSYGVAGIVGADFYDLIFLRASLGSKKPPFPGMSFRLFTMQLGWPGKEDQARCITNVIEEDLP